MQDVVHVVARMQARAGKEDALWRLIQPLIEPVRKEQGCLRYSVMQDRQNAAVLTLLEEWDTEESLNKHLALPHIQRVFAQFPELLVGPPDIARYRQLA